MKLSIVIVEYHSVEDVRRCVSAIRSTMPEVEIVVSSNSMYETEFANSLQAQYPDCRWVFNENNGGFAYAMNHGLAVAQGDYLVISNPDCTVGYGLEEMMQFLDEHKEIGAIAPQIVDNEGVVQDSCRKYINVQSFVWRNLKRIITRKEVMLDSGVDYSQIQTVDWVIGAFIMVSRAVYEKTGGLSDDYFMYAEDMDWCTRIRLAGWEVVYYPKVKIQYKGTRSARRNSGSAKVFMNSLNTYWKKFGYFGGFPKRKEIVY